MNNKAIGFLLSALFLVITFTIILLQLDVRTKDNLSIRLKPKPSNSSSAQQLIGEGKYSQATSALRHHYKHYNRNPVFIELYGKSLILSGDLSEAMNTLNKGLAEFPHNDNLRLNLAQAYYLSKNSVKAYETLNQNNQNTSLNYTLLRALSCPNPEATKTYLKQLEKQAPLSELFAKQNLALSPNQSLIKSLLK